MKKVFLDDLPRKEGFGANKNRLVIDWKNSIGHRVEFIYDDIEGEIEIINYNQNNREITIKYKEKEIDIQTGNLTTCQIGKIIGKRTDEFKINVGQQLGNLVIIERKVETITQKSGVNWNKKWYKYRCVKCGWSGNIPYYRNLVYKTEHWITEGNLINNNGCACCSNTVVVPNINSIYARELWMIELGADEEESKKITRCSDVSIKVKCPHCGRVDNKKCSDIYKNKSISCSHCSDGVSYPEKFIINMLIQLGIDFTTQLSKTTFKWCDKYRYDFYVNSVDSIIETHGIQHYKGSFKGRKLEEEQENDNAKKELATRNGINNYIVLDCSLSDTEWIKNSIMNSDLVKMFDMSKIDWLKCEHFAINNNLSKSACDLWNSKEEHETMSSLADKINLSRGTIVKYLKHGSKLGWCNYDAKEETIKSGVRSGVSTGKRIEIFRDGISLGVFASCRELSRQSKEIFNINLLSANISSVANGTRIKYKGFTFKYV